MENETFKQTKFDSMVTNRTMQLVKAVIPYIDNGYGNYIGMFIKLQELQNAARLNANDTVRAMNHESKNESGDLNNMLNDIKEYLGEDERETIETIMMMMEMMDTMNMDEDTKQNFMGNYMDMFGL